MTTISTRPGVIWTIGLVVTLALYGPLANAGGTSMAIESSDQRYSEPRQQLIRAMRAGCRRNGVVWSGGSAKRFSDRIRPRPVRSRWDSEDSRGIRCADTDAFRRARVTGQPFVH